MKNLIDVRGSSSESGKKLNKIKVSMICILAIGLNGVWKQAIAGDMLTNEIPVPVGAANDADMKTSIIPIDTIDPVPQKPELQLIFPKEDYIPQFFGKISSPFGRRKHPVTGKLKHHRGMDIPAPTGTPIYAPAKGVVIFSGWKSGFGNVIYIDHQNGYVTLIAHNSVNIAKVGDVVDRNTIIGKVGATGTATGPHMHVEVLLNGVQVNPQQFLSLNRTSPRPSGDLSSKSQ